MRKIYEYLQLYKGIIRFPVKLNYKDNDKYSQKMAEYLRNKIFVDSVAYSFFWLRNVSVMRKMSCK